MVEDKEAIIIGFEALVCVVDLLLVCVEWGREFEKGGVVMDDDYVSGVSVEEDFHVIVV